MRRAQALLLSLFVLALSACARDGGRGPPEGLSQEGRILWQFEALLHDTFRGPSVWARYGGPRVAVLDFACEGASCGPLSNWAKYAFVFREARDSSFRISNARLSSFGVHPIPVKIKGRYVACDEDEERFLITYDLGAGLSLACLTGHRID